MLVKSLKKNFNVLENGMYRIYAIGGGVYNGGLGGLIFNDIYLKSKDSLTTICGENGDRIPSQKRK